MDLLKCPCGGSMVLTAENYQAKYGKCTSLCGHEFKCIIRKTDDVLDLNYETVLCCQKKIQGSILAIGNRIRFKDFPLNDDLFDYNGFEGVIVGICMGSDNQYDIDMDGNEFFYIDEKNLELINEWPC